MTSETNDAATANQTNEAAAEKATPAKATKKKATSQKATTAENSTKATKATKAKNAKPKAKAEAKRESNDSAMVGQTLVTLARRGSKTKGASVVSSLASKLAKSPLSHGDLVKLRDAVNELASALRDADQKALAREIAVANRGVRRLERSARKSAKKGR